MPDNQRDLAALEYVRREIGDTIRQDIRASIGDALQPILPDVPCAICGESDGARAIIDGFRYEDTGRIVAMIAQRIAQRRLPQVTMIRAVCDVTRPDGQTDERSLTLAVCPTHATIMGSYYDPEAYVYASCAACGTACDIAPESFSRTVSWRAFDANGGAVHTVIRSARALEAPDNGAGITSTRRDGVPYGHRGENGVTLCSDHRYARACGHCGTYSTGVGRDCLLCRQACKSCCPHVSDLSSGLERASLAPSGAIIRSRRAVGVEVETFAPTDEQARKKAFSRRGVLLSAVGDGTLRSDTSERSGVELRGAPVAGLHAEEWARYVADELALHDYDTNLTCGAHIHVGIPEGESAARVAFAALALMQRAILGACDGDRWAYYGEYGNEYARAVGSGDVSDVRRRGLSAMASRYHTVNAHSYGQHRTLEVRAISGDVPFNAAHLVHVFALLTAIVDDSIARPDEWAELGNSVLSDYETKVIIESLRMRGLLAASTARAAARWVDTDTFDACSRGRGESETCDCGECSCGDCYPDGCDCDTCTCTHETWTRYRDYLTCETCGRDEWISGL